MNYYQKANPNATNSEMDSKTILKPRTTNPIRSLTSEQRDELISQFVELQVDNMDTQTLVEFVTDLLIDDYSQFDDNELEERITCFNDDDDLLNELVDNIKSEPPVKEVEQCIIDTNGEYAECVDHLVESMENG